MSLTMICNLVATMDLNSSGGIFAMEAACSGNLQRSSISFASCLAGVVMLFCV